MRKIYFLLLFATTSLSLCVLLLLLLNFVVCWYVCMNFVPGYVHMCMCVLDRDRQINILSMSNADVIVMAAAHYPAIVTMPGRSPARVSVQLRLHVPLVRVLFSVPSLAINSTLVLHYQCWSPSIPSYTRQTVIPPLCTRLGKHAARSLGALLGTWMLQCSGWYTHAMRLALIRVR